MKYIVLTLVDNSPYLLPADQVVSWTTDKYTYVRVGRTPETDKGVKVLETIWQIMELINAAATSSSSHENFFHWDNGELQRILAEKPKE
jgi:hypothetical protein